MTHSVSRRGFRWDVGVRCLGEQNQGDVSGKLLAGLTDGALEMTRPQKLADAARRSRHLERRPDGEYGARSSPSAELQAT